MKNIGFILMMGLCFLCACQDRDDFCTPDTADGKTEILLQQMDVPVVVTRAGEDRDTRIENVVIFVFDEDGYLLNTPVVQSAELMKNTEAGNVCYKIREYLPSNKASLYAVCNYDQAAYLIENVQSKTDLEKYVLEISSVEGAFKGAYVMEGATTNFSGTTVTVPVTRVASRQEFTINFLPLTKGETFKLSSVAILNVPRKSNLLKDETYAYEDDNTQPWTGDAVYSTSVEEMAKNYIDSTVVEVETVRENQYSLTLNLFENRRGGQTQEIVDTKLGINDGRLDTEKNKVRQLYKKDLAEGKLIDNVRYPYASCLVIEGVYQTASVAYHARYYVYLGHNNFGDFNVLRNYCYKYTITIQACDKMDTRVEADGIGNVSFFASEEPLDAHFEVRQGLLYAPADWEIYVKEPDKTPWLEISTSASYVPQQLGGTGTGSGCAQYRLKGSMGSHYIYIHADEYVPPITAPAQNPSYKERTGTICYKRADSDEVQEFTVTQKPAQLVVVEAWDVNLAKMVTHKFFVEAVPDKDYLTWGFEHHWNLTMDNLITTGQYDGLSTSRKEYVTALWGDKRSDTYNDVEQAPLALDGAQPAAYRTNGNPLTNVPVDIALGTALFKNRDRNGNGRIDYNEILWYLPGVIQLEGIQEAIGKTVTLDLQGETFWSATPSVSDKGGITPGRAYYVKMSNGKRGIGLRDQQFRVLCCRDAEGWTGPEDGNGGGNVGTDDSWTDNEQNMPK